MENLLTPLPLENLSVGHARAADGSPLQRLRQRSFSSSATRKPLPNDQGNGYTFRLRSPFFPHIRYTPELVERNAAAAAASFPPAPLGGKAARTPGNPLASSGTGQGGISGSSGWLLALLLLLLLLREFTPPALLGHWRLPPASQPREPWMTRCSSKPVQPVAIAASATARRSRRGSERRGRG